MILYCNTKVKVHTQDGDTDFFNIIVGVLQGDTVVQYMFIIRIDSVLKTSINLKKENGFTLKRASSRRYAKKTITDADYADDTEFLANILTQTESLLHSLGKTAEGIGLHVNAEKMENVCFNHEWDLFTLKWGPLKLGDKFTYLRDSVSSTERHFNIRLDRAWTTIDRLSIIRKSVLFKKIKMLFLPVSVFVGPTLRMHHMNANKIFFVKY